MEVVGLKDGRRHHLRLVWNKKLGWIHSLRGGGIRRKPEKDPLSLSKRHQFLEGILV